MIENQLFDKECAFIGSLSNRFMRSADFAERAIDCLLGPTSFEYALEAARRFFPSDGPYYDDGSIPMDRLRIQQSLVLSGIFLGPEFRTLRQGINTANAQGTEERENLKTIQHMAAFPARAMTLLNSSFFRGYDTHVGRTLPLERRETITLATTATVLCANEARIALHEHDNTAFMDATILGDAIVNGLTNFCNLAMILYKQHPEKFDRAMRVVRPAKSPSHPWLRVVDGGKPVSKPT